MRSKATNFRKIVSCSKFAEKEKAKEAKTPPSRKSSKKAGRTPSVERQPEMKVDVLAFKKD